VSTEQVPGVMVYMIYAPLWYANADYIRLRVARLLDDSTTPVRVLVLDADAIPDIDYTAAQSFAQLTAEVRARGIVLALARASHPVHHDLKHSGLLDVIGPERLFRSVEEAVRSLAPTSP